MNRQIHNRLYAIIVAGLILAAIVSGVWMKQDRQRPARALQPLRDEPKPTARCEPTQTLATSPELEPEEAREAKPLTREGLLALLREGITEGASTEILLGILQSAVEDQPLLALELAKLVARDGGEKFTLVEGVVDEWAKHDPS